jgi:hypothetical protein
MHMGMGMSYVELFACVIYFSSLLKPSDDLDVPYINTNHGILLLTFLRLPFSNCCPYYYLAYRIPIEGTTY